MENLGGGRNLQRCSGSLAGVMDPQSLHLGDWQRLLLGDAPYIFLVEAALRTVVVFVFLLATLRMLGKRMNGQLTITELAVMLLLGAIAANGMQAPDRGVLDAGIIFLSVIFFQRGLTWLESHYAGLEAVTQGRTIVLVKDGVLQLPEMKRAHVSRDQLFAGLRAQKLLNLGQAERVYFEACGVFSVFSVEEKKPGLSALPSTDRSLREKQTSAPGVKACQLCGTTRPAEKAQQCPGCGSSQWTDAVT